MMCKRLVIPDQKEAEEEISVTRPWWVFSARFNVSVSHSVPAVRLHEGLSEGVMMRWGYVPPITNGNVTRIGSSLVRSDQLLTSQDYRTAWLYGQRCIVPLAGFYVWQLTPAKFRQPWYVRLVNRLVFGVAALWERTVTDDDDVIESCALITVPANPLLAEIDASRQMPAILHRSEYETWLRSTVGQAKALLQPYPRERMLTHPVSPHVNYLEYDEPTLIQAVR